ncbi:MAG: hypothetical protein HQL97_00465 [Magnetococcales bacterium]|nr:hypothetical protein [Magnetococcales bacterium]
MTFLQLVQRLRQECGVSGTGPVTTIAQVGEYKRLVDWIVEAWLEIQGLRPDWKFLRTSTSWATIADQYAYTPLQCGIAADTFGAWVRHEMRQYNTAAGLRSEMPVYYMPYDRWRRQYNLGGLRDHAGPPREFAVAPDQSLVLGPKPPVGYTMTGDYYKAPVTLTLNADVPALPPGFSHMIIVYAAMMKYAAYESSAEVYAEGERGYTPLLCRLEVGQLEEITLQGTLC